jgi:hypothetical protein
MVLLLFCIWMKWREPRAELVLSRLHELQVTGGKRYAHRLEWLRRAASVCIYLGTHPGRSDLHEAAGGSFSRPARTLRVVAAASRRLSEPVTSSASRTYATRRRRRGSDRKSHRTCTHGDSALNRRQELEVQNDCAVARDAKGGSRGTRTARTEGCRLDSRNAQEGRPFVMRALLGIATVMDGVTRRGQRRSVVEQLPSRRRIGVQAYRA